jgi:hypothetical protein
LEQQQLEKDKVQEKRLLHNKLKKIKKYKMEEKK